MAAVSIKRSICYKNQCASGWHVSTNRWCQSEYCQPPPQALRFSHGRGERETSDWWYTARDHGKGTDVSPVVSFPPSFARTSRETSGYEAAAVQLFWSDFVALDSAASFVRLITIVIVTIVSTNKPHMHVSCMFMQSLSFYLNPHLLWNESSIISNKYSIVIHNYYLFTYGTCMYFILQ